MLTGTSMVVFEDRVTVLYCMVSPVVVAFGAPPVHVAVLRALSPVEVRVWLPFAACAEWDASRKIRMKAGKNFEF